MGNSFNIKEWWETRYRTVKTRVALWPSLRRLSLTGRNTLLQSIFYGSFRYWLYFLEMPESVIKLIESDAKQILWSTEPTHSWRRPARRGRQRRYGGAARREGAREGRWLLPGGACDRRDVG